MHDKSPQAAFKAHMLHLFYGSLYMLESLFEVFNFTIGAHLNVYIRCRCRLDVITHPVLEPLMSWHTVL